MSIFRRNKISEEPLQPWIALLRAHNYPEVAVASAAVKLEAMPDILKEALLDWHRTGDMAELSVEGVDIRQLTEVFGFNEIAAILILDWLLREPEEAKYALSQPITKIVVDDETLEALEHAEAEDSDESDQIMTGDK